MKRNVAVSALRLILPLILMIGTASAQNTVPEADVQIIQGVLNNLIRAINSTRQTPWLTVRSDNEGHAACYKPLENRIYLHSQLLDICRSFGDDSLNALAGVLGHELAHWERDGPFGSRPRSRKEKSTSGQNRRGHVRDREEQADYLAGFYGRQAGYNALAVFPDVLDKIYREYGLDDEIENYPSLKERKEIAFKVRDRLDELVFIYNMANNLSLIREYERARQCYDHIIEEFNSREMMNNAGVAYTLHALELMGDEYAGYIYPLELDADTRLLGIRVTDGLVNRATRGTGPQDSIRGSRMLDSAAKRFELAMKVDPGYSPALINRATIYILKRDYHNAEILLDSALKLDNGEVTRVKVAVQLAMIHAIRGDSAGARNKLDEIETIAGSLGITALVDVNRALLDKKSFQLPNAQGLEISRETIDGIRASEDVMEGMVRVRETIGREGMEIVGGMTEYATVARLTNKKSWVQFVCTNNGYTRQSGNDISIGSTGNQVLLCYGSSPRIVQAVQGSYYIYDYSKIIFLVGQDGRVLRWMIYAMGE